MERTPDPSPPTADAVASRLVPVLEDEPRVQFAYVFGSVGRGDARTDSDVDVAVHLAPPGTLLDDARLHDRLAAALPDATVDLVVLNRAAPWLQFRVLGDGVVIFSRDERRRIAFREVVEKMYLDYKPLHDAYLSAVRDRARRGTLSRG
jgi:predicted nucleotidyltransferase